jgi:hypothetical protein
MWGDCHRRFANQQELLSHLQVDHLQPQLIRSLFRLPQLQPQSSLEGISGNIQSPFSFLQSSNASDPQTSLPCLWNNCNASLTTNEVTTIGNDYLYPNFNDELLQHLLQNHFNNERPSNDTPIISELNTRNESPDGEGSPDIEGSNTAEGSTYQASILLR